MSIAFPCCTINRQWLIVFTGLANGNELKNGEKGRWLKRPTNASNLLLW
jgi:hypothetical protein